MQLRPADSKVPEIRLNEEQRTAYDQILQDPRGKPGSRCCRALQGSGKTEVYIPWRSGCCRRKKTAMILVPEIALTPQMMQRFSAYFGEDVALAAQRWASQNGMTSINASERVGKKSCWEQGQPCLHRCPIWV